MNAYEVTNSTTGHSFGVYRAESAEGAVLACVRDAGYLDLEDAEAAMGRMSELVAIKRPTYAEIAADWRLWNEFVNVDGAMEREEFDALSIEQKVALQVEAFGAEVTLRGRPIDMAAARALMDDELCEQIHGTVDTEQAFLEAYLVAHEAKYGQPFVFA